MHPAPAPATAADEDDDDDNCLIKVIRKSRKKTALFKTGPMQWMPDKVVYGVKEALDDLRAANRKSKKRLLSRKGPISQTGSVKFPCNFEGFMPGDWVARPQAKRDWINAHMQLVLDKRCGRFPDHATLVSIKEGKHCDWEAGDSDGDANDTSRDRVDPWDTVPDDLANELFADDANDNQADGGEDVNAADTGLEASMSEMTIEHTETS